MALSCHDVSVVASGDGGSGAPRQILSSISFTAQAGEITLLLGKTGAGKSTLLDVLSGLQRPSQGQVEVDGEPLWHGKQVQVGLRRKLSLSFQAPESQLFASSVYGEFAYSLKSRQSGGRRMARSAIEETGRRLLTEFGLPTTLLHVSPLALSQGQKRRVALATTMATHPSWLLLDEPTAALDGGATEQFVQVLQRQLREGTAGIVIATHDVDTFLPLAQRVVLLKGGTVTAVCTPEELLHDPHLFDDIGLGMPSALVLQEQLRRRGCDLELTSFAAEFTAQDLAGALVRPLVGPLVGSRPCPIDRVGGPRTERPVAGGLPDVDKASANKQDEELAVSAHGWEPTTRTTEATGATETTETTAATGTAGRLAGSPTSGGEWKDGLRHGDPRAKWLAYILISIGILSQSHWMDYTLSTAFCIFVVYLARVNRHSLFQLLAPFFVLMLFSSLLSGVVFRAAPPLWHLGIHGFHWGRAIVTLARFYRFFLMMVLGLVLAATTSQLRMKQGLEQSLQLIRLRALRAPIEAFSLATSLTLRFIPVIMGELRRFTRIAKSRGRVSRRGNGIGFRDVPQIVLPLVLSVLHIGDELSTAMEARGYRKIGQPRSRSFTLKFQRRDAAIVTAGALMLVLLWLGRMI